MQIRIMGSYEECELASDYYISLRSDPDVRYVDVSKPYPNRGNSQSYRLYVTVSYKDTYFDNASAGNTELNIR